MITLFAQPYDISAAGFYFESLAVFEAKAHVLRNDYGQPVEEFEIQFIEGERIDCQLFDALKIHHGNIGAFFEVVGEWDQNDKIKVIIAVGEASYSFDLGDNTPDEFDIDLYVCDSMRDLAMQFVEEGLFGDIPDRIQSYLDWNAIARDLSMDYAGVVIDGQNYIYRCG